MQCFRDDKSQQLRIHCYKIRKFFFTNSSRINQNITLIRKRLYFFPIKKERTFLKWFLEIFLCGKMYTTKVKYTVHKRMRRKFVLVYSCPMSRKDVGERKLKFRAWALVWKKKLCKETNSRNINIKLSKTYNTFHHKWYMFILVFKMY